MSSKYPVEWPSSFLTWDEHSRQGHPNIFELFFIFSCFQMEYLKDHLASWLKRIFIWYACAMAKKFLQSVMQLGNKANLFLCFEMREYYYFSKRIMGEVKIPIRQIPEHATMGPQQKRKFRNCWWTEVSTKFNQYGSLWAKLPKKNDFYRLKTMFTRVPYFTE